MSHLETVDCFTAAAKLCRQRCFCMWDDACSFGRTEKAAAAVIVWLDPIPHRLTRHTISLAVFVHKALNGSSPQSWRMTASLPLLPADDDFDRPTSPRVRFQELAQIWAIAHSLLLDRVCRTSYLSIYVTLNILS